jgi:hypothetical protein
MLGTKSQFVSHSAHSLVIQMANLYQPVQVGNLSSDTQKGLQEGMEQWTWIHVVEMQSSDLPEIHSDGMLLWLFPTDIPDYAA